MTDGPRIDPVFVYGALRSGTTLFRLMLNSHQQIQNPGEVDFLFDHIRPDPAHPTGWRYDLDALGDDRIFRAKSLSLPPGVEGRDLLLDLVGQLAARHPDRVLTLNVHRHAGRIATLLPAARFVHLIRDPRDVARSSVVMGWAGLSYFGVDHWIATERDWDAADIPDEQVLSLRFEDLMAEIEPRLTEVCAFMGVSFSPEMLEYYRDTTYGPPDPKIAGQWRGKVTDREVALLDGKCGTLLTSRGYAPAGTPALPGPAERLRMGVENRFGRWRKSIGMFGFPLLAAAKITSWTGPRPLHRRLRRQMDAVIIQHLK